MNTQIHMHYFGSISIFLNSRFPQNPEKRRRWVLNIHRKDWSPTNSTLICSDHFYEKFINRTQSNTTLKENAEPTRFKFLPKHLKKVRAFNKQSE